MPTKKKPKQPKSPPAAVTDKENGTPIRKPKEYRPLTAEISMSIQPVILTRDAWDAWVKRMKERESTRKAAETLAP
jgi:hypothetical protein